MEYPDDSNVTYEYDTLGRLAKVKYNGSMVAAYKYDELSRRTLLTLGNDANAVYEYDIANRLKKLKNKFNSSQTQTISYSSYDNVGNRKNMIIDSNESKYKYDKLYQLTFADYPLAWNVADVNYYYDNLANRTSTYNGSTTTYYLCNRLNQYTMVGSSSYAYDLNGNMTQYSSWRYYYDCENRLTDVNVNSSPKLHFAYDYAGRRVAKTTYSGGTVTTRFVYDGDQIIADYNNSGVLQRKYVYGPGIDEPICMIAGGNTYYYHFDGLGSVTMLTDSGGQKVVGYRYDAFGTPTQTNYVASPPVNRFMFTGREYDNDSLAGLYYYRARFYKPSIGRFLSSDSLGMEPDGGENNPFDPTFRYESGMNLYTYVTNNPINSIDPMGKALSPGTIVVVGAGITVAWWTFKFWKCKVWAEKAWQVKQQLDLQYTEKSTGCLMSELSYAALTQTTEYKKMMKWCGSWSSFMVPKGVTP